MAFSLSNIEIQWFFFQVDTHWVFLIVTISHILKNENYELCFLAGSFVDQILTGKKGTVIWASVRMFGGSMSLDCFGGFLDQNTTGKKVRSSGHWFPWARIVLVGLSLFFLADSLNQFTYYDQKKGTVIWPSVGMSTT